jgi:multidrug efflux system membrane fusion protein
MNKKTRFIYPIGILCFGIIGAFIIVKSRPKIEKKEVTFPPPLVRAQTIQLQDVQLVVKSQGTVSPRTESELFSQVAGQVIEVSPAFARGGFFSRGEVLIRVDPRDYEFAISRLKAEVAQAKLRLVQEQGEASVAREEWEKLGAGEEPNPLVLREPQLTQARAALEAAEAALKQAELNLERTRIRAPFDGRVRSKNVDLGEYVGPGIPVATIYAVDYAEVRLPVPDDQMAYLDCCIDYRGQDPSDLNIAVTLKANYAGQLHDWEGKIVRIEGEIDPKTRMVTLVARVDNPYIQPEEGNRPPFAVGLFVNAEIKGRLVENVAVIPRSAIRGKDRVLVINGENRLHFRDVSVLKANADTAVLSAGLEDGERLCLSPLETVVDGMHVRVMEEQPTQQPSRSEEDHS